MLTDGKHSGVLSTNVQREPIRAKRLPRQLVVRVDADTYERLRADAAENGRTVAQSVRFLLRRGLNATQAQQELADHIAQRDTASGAKR